MCQFLFQAHQLYVIFLEKKVYWAVFFAEFGLDLKIVRYLMGGINHTACMYR